THPPPDRNFRCDSSRRSRPSRFKERSALITNCKLPRRSRQPPGPPLATSFCLPRLTLFRTRAFLTPPADFTGSWQPPEPQPTPRLSEVVSKPPEYSSTLAPQFPLLRRRPPDPAANTTFAKPFARQG